MAALTYSRLNDPRERLGGMVAISVGLHLTLFATAFVYAQAGRHFGASWGKDWGKGGAVRVTAVSSLPGVPLPAPMLATPNTVSTENPGLYRTETKPEPPKPAAETLPKFQQAVTPEKVQRVNKRIARETIEPPDNAVPYGQGGRPAMSYTQVANAAGEGGLAFGEGNFGERYGWYVAAVRNRISNNWLLSTVSPSVLSAPRVYVTFDIQRDGTIENVQLAQSSGVPEVDRSALRAVLASNPLGPLPPDYSASKVSVEFFFDFRRR